MNLRKYSWLAVLPLLFTACQDDMLVENTSVQGITTLTATVEDGSASSRAQIVLNGTSTTKESFHWNAGDAFTLFELDEGNNVYTKTFTITPTYSDDTPAASADFTTKDESLVVGRKFSAFYPQPVMNEEFPYAVNLKLNNTLPDNSKESWVNYFKNNMFMMAQGTVSNPTAITFSQLCGIVRITYKNTSSEDRTIQGLYVNGSWGSGIGYSLDDLGITEGSGSGGQYGLDFENAATIKAGTSEDFYILFMQNLEPIENQMPLSRVEIKLDGDYYWCTPEYSKELPLFQVGKSYWLNVTDDGENLFWTNDEQGGTDNPDEGDSVLRQVSTFSELKEALSEVVGQMNIELTADIELESPLTVATETNLMLCGKTISLNEEYDPKDMPAVFNLNDVELRIYQGNLNGLDSEELHDYYFRVYGRESSVCLDNVTLNTGTAVENAFYMYHSYIYVERGSNVTTQGYAAYIDGPLEESGYTWSRINTTGTITGDFYLNTFNTRFEVLNGNINGNFNYNSLFDSNRIPEHFALGSDTTIGEGYTGWGVVGVVVKNQEYPVTDFATLKAALEVPQQADEMTNIYLESDIILTEQLTVNKPVRIYMEGRKLTLGYNLQAGEGAIINNSDLYISKVGIIEAPSTGTEVDAYLIKSGSGMVYLRHLTINAGIVKNAVYIKDGKGCVYEDATINASGFTLDIESDRYSDVDIYTGTLNGDVRWKLNSAEYTDLCRFGAGPNSIINGDLIWAGEYGGTATGYRIEFGSPVNINGANWVTTNGSGGNDSGDESGDEASAGNFSELMKALNTPSITRIYLTNNIALEEPLVIDHQVQIDLNKFTMTLDGEKFQGGASVNVIDVKNDGISFFLDNGVVDFTGYTEKMNGCIRTSGHGVKLYMADIDIYLGNSFGPAIWMDDDNLTISTGYKMPTITAPVAIYYQCSSNVVAYKATVNANINGDVEFVNTNTTISGLNTVFEFVNGHIDGQLTFSENVKIADYVKFNKGVVTFGEKAESWQQAGMME